MLLGNTDAPSESVHFIQSGKCKVVRDITIINKCLPSGNTRLTLPPINFTAKADSRTNNNERIVRKFLTIHILKKGDFFGVGEDLKDTYIITVGRVSDTTPCKEPGELCAVDSEFQ